MRITHAFSQASVGNFERNFKSFTTRRREIHNFAIGSIHHGVLLLYDKVMII
jgi:hypothetical protein